MEVGVFMPVPLADRWRKEVGVKVPVNVPPRPAAAAILPPILRRTSSGRLVTVALTKCGSTLIGFIERVGDADGRREEELDEDELVPAPAPVGPFAGGGPAVEVDDEEEARPPPPVVDVVVVLVAVWSVTGMRPMLGGGLPLFELGPRDLDASNPRCNSEEVVARGDSAIARGEKVEKLVFEVVVEVEDVLDVGSGGTSSVCSSGTSPTSSSGVVAVSPVVFDAVRLLAISIGTATEEVVDEVLSILLWS